MYCLCGSGRVYELLSWPEREEGLRLFISGWTGESSESVIFNGVEVKWLEARLLEGRWDEVDGDLSGGGDTSSTKLFLLDWLAWESQSRMLIWDS